LPGRSSVGGHNGKTGLAFTHQRVQRLRRLIRRRDSRADDGVCIVEGAKVLTEALNAGVRIDGVFVTLGTQDPVIERALAGGAHVYDLAIGVMERISDTVHPQAIVAIVESPAWTLASLEGYVRAGGFVIVANNARDPGNAGTLIRSAEAAGAAAVILAGESVEPANPKVVRSSAGGLFHVPVVSEIALADALHTLKIWGARILATAVGEGGHYTSVRFDGPLAIVLGNEARGLGAEALALADELVTIPMTGRTESLNLGMAATLLAFEARRARTFT
jgi:RNA methyltransferase, TrmH family